MCENKFCTVGYDPTKEICKKCQYNKPEFGESEKLRFDLPEGFEALFGSFDRQNNSKL